jgi:hypothetical protein
MEVFPRRKVIFSSRLRAIEEKTPPDSHTINSFRANSDCECSACSNGVPTDIIHPCTPSSSASRPTSSYYRLRLVLSGTRTTRSRRRPQVRAQPQLCFHFPPQPVYRAPDTPLPVRLTSSPPPP